MSNNENVKEAKQILDDLQADEHEQGYEYN